MSKKKVLFAGCSFTDDCGFEDKNLDQHWVRLFSNHYDCYFTNIAIGGMSNFEIFTRTVEATSDQPYDLVVVLWSEISRRWMYYSDNNVDDWTNITQMKGFNISNTSAETISKMIATYFNNDYVNLKHWLTYIIALDGYFQNKKQPYVFAKGFDNYINSFNSAKHTVDSGFEIDPEIKPLLDFDNRPDYYILEKIKVIQNLIRSVDQQAWVNLFDKSFYESKIDVADDQKHPGPLSNKNFVNQLIEHCQQRNLI